MQNARTPHNMITSEASAEPSKRFEETISIVWLARVFFPLDMVVVRNTVYVLVADSYCKLL
jgi:hypothetical protein